ncbi:hypothetical protein [uncultured Vibrio sp.]|uniref:hypothetical protein n=1 Tax=uncultured Vibrio sp. TaxID=114054 RepID=UPI0025F570E9|nr:hypothetical protein [uncultured Vibrio sp.]
MNIVKISIIIMCLAIVGCATPPEVKQLSTQQLVYFDKSMEMLRIQSAALILASEKLAGKATSNVNKFQSSGERILIEGLMESSANLTEEIAQGIVADLTTLKNDKDVSLDKIDADLEAIKSKSAELEEYVAIMKQVHLVLDAYIQSEKEGEKVLKSVFNRDSVNDLFLEVDSISNQVITTTNELSGLIKSFNID